LREGVCVENFVDSDGSGFGARGETLPAPHVARPDAGGKPKGESLARRIASSSFANVATGSTGPKVSSRMSGIVWSTFVTTVGWKNEPSVRASRSPPVSTFAPRAACVGDVRGDDA
jgi:hypothetical protein